MIKTAVPVQIVIWKLHITVINLLSIQVEYVLFLLLFQLYGVPKHEEIKTNAKKELVMLHMKHVAGVDKEIRTGSDKNS